MRLGMRPWRSTARDGAIAPDGAAAPPDGQRRREGWIIVCTAVAVLLFAFFETRLPQFSSANSLSNNVIFFLLINLNIILLVLLVFLVARNLAKLVFERRRRILGSHLRTRLVLAFLAVSIFPAVLIFLVALGFMTSSIENWFDVQVENSLAGSLDIARTYYAHASENALHHARDLAERLAREHIIDGDPEQLTDFIEAKQREYNVGTIEVYGADRARRAFAIADEVPPDVKLGKTSALLTAALGGHYDTRVQSVGDGDVIRAAVPIEAGGGVAGAVVVDYFIPQSVANRSAEIARSFQEYRQLKILKQPIISNYVVTLVLVTLLVIFCATWMGFYLAKGITVPIQKLAEGTREVAQGNWQYRIGFGEGTAIASDDEFGSLVGSFNQMTADLETSNLELEKRRRYMATILATMTGGVISLDEDGRATTINEAAERILGLDRRLVLGRDVDEVFARTDLQTARDLMQELYRNAGRASAGGGRAHRQLKLVIGGRVLTIVLTATVLRDDAGQHIGAVLFFEDVTEIVKVQRMEAWREVARRIAHEIKNPLTPIGLSAERLRRRYAERLKDDGPLFEECTRTIVRQVEELKTLVNEFATFARLPSGEHTPENLNNVVDEAMVLFKEGHRDIRFSFDADLSLPLLPLDREGIKRVVINMLDNAVAALSPPNGVERRIEVSTRFHHAHGIVALEVADTGSGIEPNARARLFEPYFSTKQGGTGLGLAIVSTIVADHQGFVRVKDNEPRGSRFVIELPVKGQVEQIVLH